MKFFLVPAALSILAAALWLPKQDSEWTLLVGGSMTGYLSPCGCTKPMQGGLRRKAQAFSELAVKDRTTRIELGPLGGGITRQEELKVEAAAEALGRAQVHVVSLSYEDVRFGSAMVASLGSLSRSALVSGGIITEGALPEKQHGPFLITSWDPKTAVAADSLGIPGRSESEVLTEFTAQAQLLGKMPLLMFEGTKAQAAVVAESNPDLAVIVYRSASNPPLEPERVGRTLLVTPGGQGKNLVKLVFKGASLHELTVHSLGPNFEDDRSAEEIYRQYQKRVRTEKLIDAMPRIESKGFAGSKACMTCHADAGEVWKNSAHAGALKTLEDDYADRDPECISCHVVGQDKTKGFKSRDLTAHLADVGCESCHGPGADHAAAPMKKKMPQAGEKSCMTCHTPEHSPNFSFEEYWPRIAH
jgi:hypothetical protein